MKRVFSSIIVDDEHPSRETLRLLIQKYCPTVQVLGTADSADSAKELIERFKPYVVFLDIQMPGGSGFDLLDRVSEIDFKIIFTTAYHDYAVKAFRLAALDYLLKPINIEELQEAVNKLELNPGLFNKSSYDSFNSTYTNGNGLDRFMLPTKEGYIFVKMEDVVYLEAQSNYTLFHLMDKRNQLVCRGMSEYEATLESFNFHRIHHKYVINLKHIELFNSKGNYIKMTNGGILDIATRRKGDFVKRFKLFV